MNRRFPPRILAASFIWILSVFLISVPSLALETGDVVISVSPASQELELAPAQTYKGKIDIANTGRLPFKVKAHVSPYYVESETYDPIFSTDYAYEDYTNLCNWVKLSEDEFLIKSGESHTLEFEIIVPSDIAPSGQYAAIMLLGEGDDSIDDTSMIKATGQIAAILYGHVSSGEAHPDGELINHELSGIWSRSGINASQTVKNTGNIDFKVQQTMTIKEFFSNREVFGPNAVSPNGDIIGMSEVVVLPNTSRTSSLSWSNTPKLGLFEVTQTISFLDQNYTFEQVVLVCPIWLIVVITIIVLFIILRTVSKSRRKKIHPEAPATPIS